MLQPLAARNGKEMEYILEKEDFPEFVECVMILSLRRMSMSKHLKNQLESEGGKSLI